MFENFKRKIAEPFINRAVAEASSRWIEERNERKRQAEIAEIECLLDKFVIVLPNEIENLTVAKVVGVDLITKAKSPVPVIHNVVSGEIYFTFAKIIPFSKQRFEALNKLHPNERIAIIYANVFGDEEPIDKSKTQLEELIDPEVWKEKVYQSMSKMKNL